MIRQTSVKALHSRRSEIKQRILQRNSISRDKARKSEINSCREQLNQSDDTNKKINEYASLGEEFQCDLGDPAVLNLFLTLEEEIRSEGLLSLYEESQREDWEAYYQHLCPNP